MKTIIKITVFLCCIGLVACDFLDRTPDNRTEIDTKDKVQKLLVSAYSIANYGMMAELSSDNLIDNNAPDSKGAFKRISPLDRIQDEAFAWDDIVSGNTQDSPFYVWNYCYKAIATANAALEAIDRLEAEGEDMNAEKGEALLCRAYHHFVLVNLFAQHYKDTVASQNDLGITYMTELENTVSPKYERLSVTETYNHIVADFEKGIKLVDESYYSVVKYHFNPSAAHAFGARLYLYLRQWDKVIEHANRVLGEDQDNAASLLFAAKTVSEAYSQPTQEVYGWIDAAAPSNLLLMPTTSWWNAYSMIPDYSRYAFTGSADTEVRTGPWDGSFYGYTLWKYGDLGTFPAKFMFIFEYSDKVAMIGQAHTIRREFTTNETLLCRAEAYIYKNEPAKAMKDMMTWANSYNQPMKENNVSTYRGTKILNNEKMSTSFKIPTGLEPYVQSVLQCRRVETLLDGLRWFDLKRYGIELTHRIGDGRGGYKDVTLSWNDERRALQLPQEAIVSGMTGNRLGVVGEESTEAYRVPGYGSQKETDMSLREKLKNLIVTKQ